MQTVATQDGVQGEPPDCIQLVGVRWGQIAGVQRRMAQGSMPTRETLEQLVLSCRKATPDLARSWSERVLKHQVHCEDNVRSVTVQSAALPRKKAKGNEKDTVHPAPTTESALPSNFECLAASCAAAALLLVVRCTTYVDEVAKALPAFNVANMQMASLSEIPALHEAMRANSAALPASPPGAEEHPKRVGSFCFNASTVATQTCFELLHPLLEAVEGGRGGCPDTEFERTEPLIAEVPDDADNVQGGVRRRSSLACGSGSSSGQMRALPTPPESAVDSPSTSHRTPEAKKKPDGVRAELKMIVAAYAGMQFLREGRSLTLLLVWLKGRCYFLLFWGRPHQTITTCFFFFLSKPEAIQRTLFHTFSHRENV